MPAELPSLKELFLSALAVAPAERGAWLEHACEHDLELRQRLERMLAAHDMPQSLLDGLASGTGPGEPATGAFGGVQAEARGMMVGPYKLLQQIGEGGMGTVYMAEQTVPVQRKVALKLIKPGMNSRQVIARFEAERQALALMDHPSIARVLDGGTTDNGRPYFVMELVKGVSITKYCDEHRLTPKQRLELFIAVCQAVQHAHQKGIIHRDLKPSNVLIALYDGKPVPKVIDFGVAKATGQKLTERTLFTEFGAVVGTLEYMSPEQAELNQLDIDTRSDIYALGVLLYELLTGTTPLERKRLKTAALLESLRIIREEEPPRPSLRLSKTEELPSIAANRGLEPKRLSGLVRGELDWIVMRCLEKDRDRRYETANGLARDIERHLNDEAVQACPPSAGYRLRKLVRRHKAAVLVATTISVPWLIAGVVVSTTLAVWATRAEGLAEERLTSEKAERERAVEAERKARDAERERRRQLVGAKLAQARAGRWSRGRPGAAVRGPEGPDRGRRAGPRVGAGRVGAFGELRDEMVVGCLALGGRALLQAARGKAGRQDHQGRWGLMPTWSGTPGGQQGEHRRAPGRGRPAAGSAARRRARKDRFGCRRHSFQPGRRAAGGELLASDPGSA